MQINAKNLKVKFGSKGQINDYVKTIIHMIEQDIMKAYHDEHKTSSVSELPTTFDIIGMEPKIAQQWIYSNIIDELNKKDFDAKLCFADNRKVWLKVTWNVEYDEEVLESMKDNIIHSLISEKDLWK